MQKSVFIPYERYKDLLLRQSEVTQQQQQQQQQQQSSNEVNQGGCCGSGVGGGGGAAASFLPSAIHSFEAQQQQTSTARLSTGRFSDASATDETSVVKLPAAPESSCS